MYNNGGYPDVHQQRNMAYCAPLPYVYSGNPIIRPNWRSVYYQWSNQDQAAPSSSDAQQWTTIVQRRDRSHALRIVDPCTNRDVLTGEYVLPVVDTSMTVQSTVEAEPLAATQDNDDAPSATQPAPLTEAVVPLETPSGVVLQSVMELTIEMELLALTQENDDAPVAIQPAPLAEAIAEPEAACDAPAPNKETLMKAMIIYSRESIIKLRYAPASRHMPPELRKHEVVVIKSREILLRNEVAKVKNLNAWNPPSRNVASSGATAADPETIKTQDLYKNVRSILNKMAPATFDKLLRKFKALTIDTEERLSGVIKLLLDKVADDTGFSAMYAKMCRCFCDGDQGNKFRILLLRSCQKEFEKDNAALESVEQMKRQLDSAEAGEKEQLREQLDDLVAKNRRRTFANIKFIGELFKEGMLQDKIMHECITRLLDQPHDEESLECLCRLLNTMGKEFEYLTRAASNEQRQRNQQLMSEYLHRLQLIVREDKLSPRVRFMIQDVMELRNNKWNARHQAANVGVIVKQVDKETERQEQQKVANNKCDSNDDMNDWQHVSYVRYPTGRKGMTPKPVTKVVEARSSASYVLSRGGLPKLTAARTGQRLQGTTQTAHKESEPVHAPPVRVIAESVTSDEELERKARTVLGEYLTNDDVQESVIYLRQSLNAAESVRFIYHCVLHVLERNCSDRCKTGFLLQKTVDVGLFSSNQLEQGFDQLIESPQDFLVDIPKLWQYVDEIVEPMSAPTAAAIRAKVDKAQVHKKKY